MNNIYLTRVIRDTQILRHLDARRSSRVINLICHAASLTSVLFLTGCLQVARPVVKIGLVAPFEGRYRDVGYEVVHAVRLALSEANAAGGAGGYSLELVTLDDGGDPNQALQQARKLLTDPQVVAVLGHWLDSTTLAAAPVYAKAGLPFLATSSAKELAVSPLGTFRFYPTHSKITERFDHTISEAGGGTTCMCGVIEGAHWLATHRERPAVGGPLWGLDQFPRLAQGAEGVLFITPAPMPRDAILGDEFAVRYRKISDGVEPAWLAVLAYDAAQTLISAIAASPISATPATVSSSLAQISLDGLSGHISFNAEGNWKNAHISVYKWKHAEIVN